MSKKFSKSIFFSPKDKVLAKKISIKSPAKFKQSIANISKGGVTLKEFKALNLAKTRSKVMLQRTQLSSKERKQFKKISRSIIPKPTR